MGWHTRHASTSSGLEGHSRPKTLNLTAWNHALANFQEVDFMNIRDMLAAFIKDESGQGITEYGAVLAFVALLVAVVFGFARGALQKTLSQSFSAVVQQLGNLNSYSAASTS